jgi:DNA-binding winged helix-turn-helix (wHTH) protein
MAEDLGGRVRFGGFELDLHSGELCPIEAEDNQQKILLREQPFLVLRMLIASQGKIVTREAIKKQLWPNDTIVDFDHSINVAIGILRRTLGDSKDNPKYIETLARRGYRLRTPVELRSGLRSNCAQTNRRTRSKLYGLPSNTTWLIRRSSIAFTPPIYEGSHICR